MAHTVKKSDWEEFMAVGRVPPHIRRDVLQSWRRSAANRIAKLKRAPLLTEEQLLTQRALSRRLRSGARDALNRAGRLLDGADSILLLCDSAGVVVDAVGDERTLGRGRENHLHLGGDWTEEAIGTNAIGTAIHLGRAVELREAEHFCEEIQRWSCAATPVFDPGAGKLLGVVDISWPGGAPHPNALALSAALALQVESELSRLLSRDREALMEQLHLRRLRRGSEPMLVMDRSGADVLGTQDFSRFCADDDALSALRARIPELIDQKPDTLAEALSNCMPGADLEVIAPQGDAIGVMISLRRSRAAPPEPGAELTAIGAVGSASADLCGRAKRLARTAIPILIEGETGVGKTYLAQAIHRASAQADGPFELIDCPRLGIDGLRQDIADGRFSAVGGVLCLNSPGAAAADVQKLLLNLVEDVSRDGMRVIALSTRPLYQEMRRGAFRGDLYYRIAAARLEMPPLRERADEIAPLLRRLAQRHAADTGGRELRFTSGALQTLNAYVWPGNLREMRNLIAALDALSPTGLIDERALPPEVRLPQRSGREETLRDIEKHEILAAIDAEDGNLSRAAKRLGIARSTLYLKLDSYGISRKR